MSALTDHPINTLRPAQNPDQIQLYSFPTPNGIKVGAMLEETGLPYEAHTISIMRDDQLTPEYLALNPNNKIPALIDPNGPNGEMVEIFESGAILIYLAEKSGKFLPADGAARAEVLTWLMWQMGGLGPMLGQFGHFYKFAADKTSDTYAKDRYTGEARRLLGVLDKHLVGKDFVAAGEYTIADLAIWPWLKVIDFYGGEEVLGLGDFAEVQRYLALHLSRPASQKALNIPDRNG
ncbi:glutathione S-transferase N-terminal domain-containing protein [Pontivivens insulae]|uniref:Disulfide-bond oxidoreductase YghU n=1 Tax=Pontivivens insulae TaxID=1639689 RepID=A0A2R8A9M5_9RHOB|nr:glutathione S-transferase N-terminal domain-containing protein [Pontivivens insulae]RED12689.1 GST-like protein [Pontivivens insulae]SPF28780.1 Disulfide-bond oxidoreductase YghU [Pontivivens insulae]